MDYVYFHHIVDVLAERGNEVMFFLLFIFFIISFVSVYLGEKKSKHLEGDGDVGTECAVNSKTDNVIPVVMKSSVIILVVTLFALLAAHEFHDAHDRKVKIETTKTWTRVTATILDSYAEEKYIYGKNSHYDHCYHIQVGYDINQIHYTSEIEFLDPCTPDLAIGANYTNAAKYYYPLHYTLQVFIDPSNPRHIRDMSYIQSKG